MRKLSTILTLDKKDENTFVCSPDSYEDKEKHFVYGGFLFAQSLIAAQKTVGPGFLPHSLHAYFLSTST